MKTQLYQIQVVYSKTKLVTLPQQLPIHLAVLAAQPIAEKHMLDAAVRVEPVVNR